MPARSTVQRSLLLLIPLMLLVVLVPNGRAAPSARSLTAFDPEVEQQLFDNGYTKNIVDEGGVKVLRASQRNYTRTTWMRDLDYAMTGYGYTLHDMTILRDNLQLFLNATDANGVVPETYDLVRNAGVNSRSWDSMPNAIHASYVYVAKTGDTAWTQQHIGILERISGWIERLDSNNDGLPDQDIFPYGYYDTVENSVMHTYAIAKFYEAYRSMAALERLIGRDGSRYETLAQRLRAGFHLAASAGGYWLPNQTWPLAWRKADGRVVPLLETFGVFQAAQDGLIGPQDGWRYRNLMATMHDSLPLLIGGPTPTKLTIGGYSTSVRRDIVPEKQNWMLDAAAPWISGIHAPAVAEAGYPDDAAAVLAAYRKMVSTATPPTVEFAAGDGSRYGNGDSGDRGRTWDNAAWFAAIYGGHFGLTMTPDALIVAPHPIAQINGDRVDNFLYQGAQVTLELDASNRVYRLSSDRPARVLLRPVGDGATIAVDGIERGPEWSTTLSPGQSTYVQSLGYSTQRSDAAFEQVWRKADAPIQRGEATRSWLWGPIPFRTTAEAYAESPGGSRLVDYYDKARMEITRPNADRKDRWFVTNGLLVKELVSGKLQTGDAQFVDRQPSDQQVAGDPGPENHAPAYRVFKPYTSLDSDQRAEQHLDTDVVATLDSQGQLGNDPTRAAPETRIAHFDTTLGHNIPGIFWQFLQDQPDDWLFAFGYPISEPYWIVARVGGVDKWVLVQLFERRTLTYTPDNPKGFEVEMGNVGQHYHTWRYGFQPWQSFVRTY